VVRIKDLLPEKWILTPCTCNTYSGSYFHAFRSTATILQDILIVFLAHAGDVLWRTPGMAYRIALNRSRTS